MHRYYIYGICMYFYVLLMFKKNIALLPVHMYTYNKDKNNDNRCINIIIKQLL